MGFFDTIKQGVGIQSKKKRRLLSTEDKKTIDELLDENPDLTNEEIALEIDKPTNVVAYYVRRRGQKRAESIADVITSAKARVAREMLNSGDPEIVEALKQSFIAELSGKAAKSPMEQLKEMATTMKEMQQAISGVVSDGNPGRYESDNPTAALKESVAMLSEIREVFEEFIPQPDRGIGTEMLRTIKEVLPEVTPYVMPMLKDLLLGYAQQGALVRAQQQQYVAPTSIRVEAPMQQQQIAAPVPVLAPADEVEEMALAPIPQNDLVDEPLQEEEPDDEAWGLALQTVIPLLGRDPGEAADAIWHAAEYARINRNARLYTALRRLADLSIDDAKQVFIPLVMRTPALGQLVQPLLTAENMEWLVQTQAVLRSIFLAEDETAEPEEEEEPEPKKRRRKKQDGDL